MLLYFVMNFQIERLQPLFQIFDANLCIVIWLRIFALLFELFFLKSQSWLNEQPIEWLIVEPTLWFNEQPIKRLIEEPIVWLTD